MLPSAFHRLVLAAAAALFSALPMQASAFSDLVIFGDSLSDTGNNAVLLGTDPDQVIDGNSYIPTYPYASGRYSNGEVWTVDFARSLGLEAVASRTGGHVYAHGGTRTRTRSPDGVPSARWQMRRFLRDEAGVADPDALYVIGLGGNNARDTLDAIAGGEPLLRNVRRGARQYAGDVGRMVDRLQEAGARRIVVWNIPDLAVAPAVLAEGSAATFLAGVVVGAMNDALAARLSGESGVTVFDTFGVFDQVVQNPAQFGLTNVTDACGARSDCDPSSHLFWDGIHPTSAGHAILSQAMQAAVVPEPGSAALLLLGLAAVAVHKRRLR